MTQAFDFVRTTRDGSGLEDIHNGAPFKKLGRAIARSGANDCPKLLEKFDLAITELLGPAVSELTKQ
jgi:hypothetical protein